MINIDDVLAKLKDVTPAGPKKWKACCPAHDDTNPSLSVWLNQNGKISFKCWSAGCSYKDIMKALGLEQKLTRKQKDFYDYPNVDKNTLEQFFKIKSIPGKPDFLTSADVRIKDNKELRFLGYNSADSTKPSSCIRVKVDGSLIPLKNGSKENYPVLGRAGLLGIKTIAGKDVVIICEGLKDWLTAKTLGFDAVSSTNGANTFKPEWADNFKDKTVYILYDCDKAGFDGSHKAALILFGVAKEVHIVKLPYEFKPKHGKDLNDYIYSDRHTLQELRQLIDEAKLFEPSPVERRELQKDRLTYPYLFCEDGIYLVKDESKAQIANFTGKILISALRDDGIATERYFKVELSSAGRKRTAEMPAVKFADMRWIAEVGHSFIIQPGSTNKEHCRVAIQKNSLEAAEETVYVHTGWRKIDGKAVYLTGNGAIGNDGWIENVSVKLPADLAYSLSIPDKNDLQKSVQASLDFLHTADITITLPLLCAAYRSVLGNCDYSLFLVGKTGFGKSVLSAMAQQHFGKELSYMALPANWSSTANSLESIAFIAKDTLLVVDDFSSQGYLDKAERLLRAQGNNSARQRLNSDSTLKIARPPRGLIISTGEDLPPIQSILARCQIVEIEEGMVDWDRVSRSQEAASAGLLEQAMGGYICWLANKIHKLQKSLLLDIHSARLEFSSRGYSHKRTCTIAANQFIGLRTFCQYALDMQAINSSKYNDLLNTGYEVLGQLGINQTKIQNESNPASQFIEAIQSAISSGKAHLASPEGNHPVNASAFGWRLNKHSLDNEWQAYGERIGWVNSDEILLDPTSSYKVAQDMLHGKLGISNRGLRKLLVSDGLVVPETARGTNTVRRNMSGNQRNVLLLRKDIFNQQETDEFVYPEADTDEIPF